MTELERLKEAVEEALKAYTECAFECSLDVCYLADKPMSETLTKPRSVGLPYQTIHIKEKTKCKTHPDAPHGFSRNASHSEGRYVCECEHWKENT